MLDDDRRDEMIIRMDQQLSDFRRSWDESVNIQNGKMAEIKTLVSHHIENSANRHTKAETRLEALERVNVKRKGFIAGISTVGAIIGSTIGAIVALIIK